jgi:hypothetical protein
MDVRWAFKKLPRTRTLKECVGGSYGQGLATWFRLHNCRSRPDRQSSKVSGVPDEIYGDTCLLKCSQNSVLQSSRQGRYTVSKGTRYQSFSLQQRLPENLFRPLQSLDYSNSYCNKYLLSSPTLDSSWFVHEQDESPQISD